MSTRLEQGIHWLQQKTKTDITYLAKNGGYVFLSQVFVAFMGVIQFIVVGRLLPTEVYGQYKYFLSIHSLFAIATLNGMDYALGKDIALGKDSSVWIALKKKLFFGFFGSVLMLGVALWEFFHGNPLQGQAFLLVSVFSPWVYAFTIYNQIFLGKKRFDSYAKAVLFSNLTTVIPLLLVFYFSKNPVIFFAVYLSSQLTNILVFMVAQRTLHADTFLKETHVVQHAVHLSALDVFGTVANTIDSILVFHFLGSTQLAIYSLAILPVEQVRGMLKSIQGVAAPKFAQGRMEEIQHTLKHRLRYFFVFTSGVTFLYIVFASPFYHLLLPRYVSSILFSQIFSLTLIFSTPASLINTLFISQGMKKKTTIFNVVAYSLQIILLVVLSWHFGIMGTIAARLMTSFGMFVISYVLVFPRSS